MVFQELLIDISITNIMFTKHIWLQLVQLHLQVAPSLTKAQTSANELHKISLKTATRNRKTHLSQSANPFINFYARSVKKYDKTVKSPCNAASHGEQQTV